MLRLKKQLQLLTPIVLIICLFSCKKIAEWTDENPDIEPLKHGFKTSAAIGYCVSLAATVFQGGPIPDNVILESTSQSGYSSSGILYLKMSSQYPLPFNRHIGDIVIAGIWDNNEYGNMNAGVISIVFGNLDLFGGEVNFYGIHTVPVLQDRETGRITAVFARQDIVMGVGSDTLLNLSLSNPQFSSELLRLEDEQPDDVFAAVSQNVWFVNIDQHDTPSVYDDTYIVNGGGQIAEASSNGGGIQYHAMIGAEFNYNECTENPLSGNAFIQNLKADTGIELGNILLDFHTACDGQAYVEFSSGEYFNYIGRHVNLNFN